MTVRPWLDLRVLKRCGRSSKVLRFANANEMLQVPLKSWQTRKYEVLELILNYAIYHKSLNDGSDPISSHAPNTIIFNQCAARAGMAWESFERCRPLT
jgi:hypothetical protein